MNSHSPQPDPLPLFHCGGDALDRLSAYCRQHALSDFILVADQNTYPALGQAVEQALTGQGASVSPLILRGDPLAADEAAVTQILLAAPGRPCVFLAVGSGTINDLVRFVSHRVGSPFLSLPTAPSVDGYTSAHAALILGGFKKTISAHPPLAIFAHLHTLCAAPPAMIAAGFGDLLGKFTSLADWQLGALLWDEPYQADAARQTRGALEEALDQAASIASAAPAGIRALMEALVASGLGMLQAGSSRPASGAEHHLAHFWEMKALEAGRPALLHGAKVGVAAGLIAGLYARIRALTAGEVSARVSRSAWPESEKRMRALAAAYGPLAGQVVAEQKPFLEIDPARLAQLKEKILSEWPRIQEIAGRVPPPEQLHAWLRQVGAAALPADLGLSQTEVDAALAYADALRSRFTILKLAQVLSLSDSD